MWKGVINRLFLWKYGKILLINLVIVILGCLVSWWIFGVGFIFVMVKVVWGYVEIIIGYICW